LPDDFWKPLKMYKIFGNKETEILYRDPENSLDKFYELKD
jgi:hypothetical protein